MEPGGLNVERVRTRHLGDGCLEPSGECPENVVGIFVPVARTRFRPPKPKTAILTSRLDRILGEGQSFADSEC